MGGQRIHRFLSVGLAVLLGTVTPVWAEDARQFRLRVAEELETSGLMQHILPRFMLKTQRRGEIVSDGADAVFAAGQGTPVAARNGLTYGISVQGDNDAARRFADWLQSDIGLNTITVFEPLDGAPFGPPEVEVVVEEFVFEGDVVLGAQVADTHCTRCHRVREEDRSTIGSTPSFMAMKALPDWAERFMAFYVLNPHPSFMQVEGISPPFDPARPPAIIPVEISLEEVDALLAYVSTVAAADLGAEIQHQ